MLHTGDTLSPHVTTEEANELISNLRKLAVGKSDLDDYHKWKELMLAAAELERCYIRAGIIADERFIPNRRPYHNK